MHGIIPFVNDKNAYGVVHIPLQKASIPLTFPHRHPPMFCIPVKFFEAANMTENLSTKQANEGTSQHQLFDASFIFSGI